MSETTAYGISFTPSEHDLDFAASHANYKNVESLLLLSKFKELFNLVSQFSFAIQAYTYLSQIENSFRRLSEVKKEGDAVLPDRIRKAFKVAYGNNSDRELLHYWIFDLFTQLNLVIKKLPEKISKMIVSNDELIRDLAQLRLSFKKRV